MIRRHEGHAQKLHHVQKYPDGHVCADGYVPAVPELELFLGLAVVGAQIVQPASLSREDLAVWAEEVLDEEEVDCGDDERGEEEVHEDEDEDDLEHGGGRGGVCEAPGERGEELERGEEVCEGGVWAVVGFGGLFLGRVSGYVSAGREGSAGLTW